MNPSKQWTVYSMIAIALFIWQFPFEFVARANQSQAAPREQNSDSAMAELVLNLTGPLKRAHAKKLVVLDLRGSRGQEHPVGKWLSDELSAAIKKEFPKITVIDRSQLAPNGQVPQGLTSSDAIFREEITQARSVGANVFIAGDFAKISQNEVGVSVSIIPMSHLEKTHEMRTQVFPISNVMQDLSKQEPIPGLEYDNGIPVAGGGIAMPVCTHCPPASPEPENGVVQLRVVVTSQGRTGTIEVIASPSPELTASAVRAVRSWRFKPATGFDGKPIAVVVPIQCSFRGFR